MKRWLAAALTLVLFPAAAQDDERFAGYDGAARTFMQANAKAPDAAFTKFADRYLQTREKLSRARGEEIGACIEKETRTVEMVDLDGDGRDEGLIRYAWVNCDAGNYSASTLDVFTMQNDRPLYAGTAELGTSMVGFGQVTDIGKGVLKVSGDTSGKGFEGRIYRFSGGRLK